MAILGIDIGGTNIRVGLIENDELVRVERLEIKNNCSEEEIIGDIISSINKYDIACVEGIGIGVPSVVDIEKGIVYDVQNIPSWKEVHLKDILETKFKIQVYLNNDANCFAVGEKYFGKVKEFKNIVGLIIGTGLGSGLIINNRLYTGYNCGAGEFGMVPFKEYNYEYYCSGQFFNNKYNISGEECYEKATANNFKALKIFAEYGANLGEAIKMILYTFDPQVIVLGGSVSKSYRFFKDEMWKTIKSFAYPKSVDKIKIEVSEKKHIAVLGAAALYLDSKLEQ